MAESKVEQRTLGGGRKELLSFSSRNNFGTARGYSLKLTAVELLAQLYLPPPPPPPRNILVSCRIRNIANFVEPFVERFRVSSHEICTIEKIILLYLLAVSYIT